MIYHFTLQNGYKQKRQIISRVSKEAEGLETSDIAGGNIKWNNFCGTQFYSGEWGMTTKGYEISFWDD